MKRTFPILLQLSGRIYLTLFGKTDSHESVAIILNDFEFYIYSLVKKKHNFLNYNTKYKKMAGPPIYTLHPDAPPPPLPFWRTPFWRAPPSPPPAYNAHMPVGAVNPPTLRQGLSNIAYSTAIPGVPMALAAYYSGADIANSIAFGVATGSVMSASALTISQVINPNSNLSGRRAGLAALATLGTWGLALDLSADTFLRPIAQQDNLEQNVGVINLERRAQDIADVSLLPRGEYYSLPELPPSWAHSPDRQYSQRINPDNTVSLCNRLSGEDAWVCIPR
jgi:hypothetical protein